MKNVIRQNFTLVELLVVIGIILVLASIGFGTYSIAQNKARVSATEAIVRQIDQALDATRTKGLRPPVAKNWTEIDGDDDDEMISFSDTNFTKEFRKHINGDVLRVRDGKVVDAWGNPIYWRNPGKFNRTRWEIVSAGPDGKFGKSNTETPSDGAATTEYKDSNGKAVCDDITNF